VNAARSSSDLRQYVRRRATYRCEYCLLAEDDGFFAHEIDHVIADKHGGASAAHNLALACFDCNRFKGSDIASIDPLSGSLVRLFDPRTDPWEDHFEADGAILRPLTDVGRATEKLLKLNLPVRVVIRRKLVALGRYPG